MPPQPRDVLDRAAASGAAFDRRVMVPRPDVKGRRHPPRAHQRRRSGTDVELNTIARGTPGSRRRPGETWSTSALLAARNNKDGLTTRLRVRQGKVMMGSERRSMIISDKEKANTAWHGPGTLLAAVLPACDRSTR